MLARKSFVILSSRIVGSLISFVALFFVARLLGPEALGKLGFVTGIIGMFTFILYMGFDNAHIKRISEGKDLGKCIGTYASIRLFLTVLYILIVVSSVLIWENLFNNEISNEYKFILLLLLLSTSFDSLRRIGISTFNALKESAKVSTPDLGKSFLQAPIKIIVAFQSMGAIGLAGANLIGSFFGFLISLFFLRNYKISSPSYSYFKSYLKFALPTMFLIFFFRISTNIDKVMIGLYFDSEEVGYYYTTTQIFSLIMVGSASVSTLLFPSFSKSHSEGNFDRMNYLAQASERYMSLLLMPLVFMIIFFSEEIVYLLLGSKFLSAIPLFRLAALNTLLVSLNRSYNSIIPACNLPGLAAKISMFGIVVVICSNLLLIPDELFGFKLFGLGAFGALLGTFFWAIIYALIARYFCYKIASIKPFNYRIILHMISSLFMCLTLNYAIIFLNPDIFLNFIILSFIGFLIYFLFLFIIGEFTKNDFNYIKDTINPIKFKNYFLREIKN